MLKEFAFTPQVFDPNASPHDPRWREYIRAIILSVFRVPAVPPIVVAGMHWDGDESGWEGATRALIETISDDESRRDAQALFTQVSKHLVRRAPAQDWPGDEEPGWGLEAAMAHRFEPLHRILAQRIESVPDDAPRAPLAAVMASDFWSVLHEEPPQFKTMADAVAPLRLILRHSDMLVLSMPYENCKAFAVECIRQACTRPSGARRPTVHIHREAPPHLEATMASIRSEVVQVLNGAEVLVYFWPWREPYRERLVLGCRLADLGGGKHRPTVRWGVAMTHLWGEGDPAAEAPGTYSLLSTAAGMDHLKRLQLQATALGVRVVRV